MGGRRAVGGRTALATPPRLVRVVGLGAGLGAVAGGYAAGWGRPAWWAAPLLALVVSVAELAVVHLSFGRQRYSFSCTEGAVAAALVASPGGWTVAAIAVGALVAQLVRRQPRVKVGYNVAQLGAATAAATLVAGAAGHGVLGASAGMAAFWVVNHALVCVAVALTSGRRPAALVLASAPTALLHGSGNSALGLLGGWLALHAPLGLLGLVVPMGLLWSSYQQQTHRAAEARLFAELARGQERAGGRDVDLSAQVVVTAAARLFGGADVELVLLTHDGPVRYLGDEAAAPTRERVAGAALDAPWALRALGAGGVGYGVEDGRPWCSAVLGDPLAPLALLHARRLRGAAPFGRRDVLLATVLANQVESWLSVADLAVSRDLAVARAEAAGQAARALGDLGAHTVPSLGVLRESAARLARLAAAPDGADPVADIVEELHAVERAVASLLGAVVLAAEGDIRGAPGAPAAGQPEASGRAGDWTTTGVLVRSSRSGDAADGWPL